MVNFSVAFFQLLNPVVVKAVSPFLQAIHDFLQIYSKSRILFSSLYKQPAKDMPCTTMVENFGHFLSTELVWLCPQAGNIRSHLHNMLLCILFLTPSPRSLSGSETIDSCDTVGSLREACAVSSRLSNSASTTEFFGGVGPVLDHASDKLVCHLFMAGIIHVHAHMPLQCDAPPVLGLGASCPPAPAEALVELEWHSLKQRRYFPSLSLLCKRSRVNSFRYSFFINASFLWNKLPFDVASASSYNSFKRKLKAHLACI